MNAYEEKIALKKARYAQMAEALQEKSNAMAEKASRMASVIPMGQPILTDHYSARRDIKYRGSIHSTFGKAAELEKKAEHYKGKADLYGEISISSADPDAIKKLEAELEEAVTASNRRRIKERIASLKWIEKLGTLEEAHKSFTYKEDTGEEKRVMLFFPGKPDEAARTLLKKNAFRWSPTRGAWVRLLTPAAIQVGRRVRDELLKMERD